MEHRQGKGYLQAKVCGKSYLSHRIAWLLMTKKWPSLVIDHINGVRDDNRWANLRLISHAQNAANAKRKLGRSGHRNVVHDLNSGRYRAYAFKHCKKIFLGSFATLEEAVSIATETRIKNRGEFARHD